MKNKAKRQFHNQFKWWDYSYMLEAIELWASNASYKHLTKGHHLNNEVVAKDLKILAELAKRLRTMIIMILGSCLIMKVNISVFQLKVLI